MILSTLTNIIVYLLSIQLENAPNPSLVTVSPTGALKFNHSLIFELRHQHAVSPTASVAFSDIPASHIYSHKDGISPYRVQTRRITSYRPPSFDMYSEARIRSIRHGQSTDLPWEEDDIIGPDIESREALLQLAKMTSNAYLEHDDPHWYDLGDGWLKVSHTLLSVFKFACPAAPSNSHHVSITKYLTLSICYCYRTQATHLVGSQRRMDSEATSLLLQTIPL